MKRTIFILFTFVILLNSSANEADKLQLFSCGYGVMEAIRVVGKKDIKGEIYWKNLDSTDCYSRNAVEKTPYDYLSWMQNKNKAKIILDYMSGCRPQEGFKMYRSKKNSEMLAKFTCNVHYFHQVLLNYGTEINKYSKGLVTKDKVDSLITPHCLGSQKYCNIEAIKNKYKEYKSRKK